MDETDLVCPRLLNSSVVKLDAFNMLQFADSKRRKSENSSR